MLKTLCRRQFFVAGALAGVVGALGMPAQAQTVIPMVAIDGYPANSMWVKEFSEFFIPRVNERLAATGTYSIAWQEAYGGQIVKPRGVLEGIKLGLGDIGIVTTIFHNSALPSQAISGVTPFVSADARVVARAVDEIATEFPATLEEYAAENQVYLATAVVLDTYQVFSKNQLTDVSDLEGLKVAGAGINLRYLEGIPNAAGVQGGLTDFYNMLQTGVVDAALLWPEAANTYKIAEVAPFMLRADLGAVNTKTVTVNADTWAKLPEEVRTVLREVAIQYRDRVADVAMEEAAASVAAYVAAGGTVTDLSPEARSAWANSMPDIATEWAAGLDAVGRPGTAMLQAYMAKLRAAGQVPARNWDGAPS
ncbi:C4-dicarboxylate TRAP transporter substrate-binding protein [Phaeovulum sp.]|uniref:C4-dicarboxylate TRAP transporter substrate-binding protein n=1 Tax=Phaeovulum sp. TaxID=2934796 RepID=UPI003566D454